MDNPTLSGFLPPFLEAEVSDQWALLGSILPEMEELNFDSELDKRKSAEWYKRVQQSMNKDGLSTTDIALQSEDKGLSALLSFSWLCLLAAEQTEGDDQDGFVKLAMSILLPVVSVWAMLPRFKVLGTHRTPMYINGKTQFSIDKQVWQSQIGKKVINLKHSSTLDFLVDSSSHRCIGLTLNKDPPQKRRSQNQPSRRETREPQVTFQPRPPRGRPVAQAFKVPTSLMLREWRKEALDLPGNDAQANRMMRNLDDAIKALKQSRSLNALQVASIDVASSLLEVASRPECNNPFVCLQQAAMFANMGSKRGSNDEKFKGYLTRKDRCTPTDALVVLGRADCLRYVVMHRIFVVASHLISTQTRILGRSTSSTRLSSFVLGLPPSAQVTGTRSVPTAPWVLAGASWGSSCTSWPRRSRKLHRRPRGSVRASS